MADRAKVTLVKLRVSRRHMLRWWEIGYLCGILSVMAFILLIIGAAQYVNCRMSDPETNFEKCFRHTVWGHKDRAGSTRTAPNPLRHQR